jgi:hypothetical protein
MVKKLDIIDMAMILLFIVLIAWFIIMVAK